MSTSVGGELGLAAGPLEEFRTIAFMHFALSFHS